MSAEDLTQEVFLHVVRGSHEYEPRQRERAWVFRIARNVFLDHWRHERRTPTGEADVERTIQPSQSSRISLREALARLPADDREAFLLREIAGLSYAEIAATTSSTVAAVRSRIYRARLALRDMLIPPAPLAPDVVRRYEEHD